MNLRESGDILEVQLSVHTSAADIIHLNNQGGKSFAAPESYLYPNSTHWHSLLGG